MTLLLCALLYTGSALILGSRMPLVALMGGIVFLTLMYLSYRTTTNEDLLNSTHISLSLTQALVH